MGIELAKVFITAVMDGSGVRQGMQGIERDIGSAAASIRGTLKGMFVGAVAYFGLSSLRAVINESVTAWGEQEEGFKRVQAVIEATGGAAGYTADQLDKMASEMQAATTYGDEMYLAGMAKMLTFRKVTGDEFRRAMMLTADLAAVGMGSIAGSSMQLGRALEDPARGMMMLRRVGVSFSQAQIKQIKQLQAEGKLREAQRVLLKEVETQVGGVAKAMAETDTGKIKQLNNTIGDTKEVIGKAMMPVIVELKRLSLEVWTAISEKVKEFAPIIKTVTASASKAIDSMMASMKRMAPTMTPIIATLVTLKVLLIVISSPFLLFAAALTAAGIGMYQLHKEGVTVNDVLKALSDRLSSVSEWINNVTAGFFEWTGISGYIRGIGTELEGLWSYLQETLGPAISEIYDVFGTTFQGIKDALTAGDMQAAGDIAMLGLKIAWTTGVNALTRIWLDFKVAMIEAFAGIVIEVSKMWAGMITGIANSITDMAMKEGVMGDFARDLLGVDPRQVMAERQRIAAALDPVRKRNLEEGIATTEGVLQVLKEQGIDAARAAAEAIPGMSLKGTAEEAEAQLLGTIAQFQKELGQSVIGDGVMSEMTSSINGQIAAARQAVENSVLGMVDIADEGRDDAMREMDARRAEMDAKKAELQSAVASAAAAAESKMEEDKKKAEEEAALRSRAKEIEEGIAGEGAGSKITGTSGFAEFGSKIQDALTGTANKQVKLLEEGNKKTDKLIVAVKDIPKAAAVLD